MIEILEKIFGSSARVKIMRLFLFNAAEAFDIEQIVERSQVSPAEARREAAMMEKIGLIKSRSFFKDSTKKTAKKGERVRVNGWTLDDTFEYLVPLQNMLVNVIPLKGGGILNKLARVGKLKLVIVAGVFIQNWDSRIDLMVVGEGIKKHALENIVKTIESELGTEIRYSSFETADFQYRLGVYDKLIRDVLDYPHETLLDKLNISAKQPLV